ncbi:MAG TPA: hypothetical protein VLX32_08290 [Candidatus Acidoferrum sp.]|nr:hypothetical protein [Candidatus Acidoferrum sp.]
MVVEAREAVLVLAREEEAGREAARGFGKAEVSPGEAPALDQEGRAAQAEDGDPEVVAHFRSEYLAAEPVEAVMEALALRWVDLRVAVELLIREALAVADLEVAADPGVVVRAVAGDLVQAVVEGSALEVEVREVVEAGSALEGAVRAVVEADSARAVGVPEVDREAEDSARAEVVPAAAEALADDLEQVEAPALADSWEVEMSERPENG